MECEFAEVRIGVADASARRKPFIEADLAIKLSVGSGMLFEPFVIIRKEGGEVLIDRYRLFKLIHIRIRDDLGKDPELLAVNEFCHFVLLFHAEFIGILYRGMV